MYLQNKQENGGGAPIASPMPKSDQGIKRVKESIFFSKECRTFLVVIPPSFMEEEDDPISMEIDGRGKRAFFACHGLFFLF